MKLISVGSIHYGFEDWNFLFTTRKFQFFFSTVSLNLERYELDDEIFF